MERNLKTGLLLATAIAVALTSSPASAKIKVPGWAKKAEKAITNGTAKLADTANGVSKSTEDVFAEGVGYTNFAAAQAKGYADADSLQVANLEATANKWTNLAEADTASAVMGFKNYADRMAADSAAVGQSEFAQIRTDAIKANNLKIYVLDTLARRIYNKIGPIVGGSDTLARYVADTCLEPAKSGWGKITPFVTKAKALDGATQEAVFRVLRTIGRGNKPDRQTATDMLAVGQALGMVSANGLALVGNAYKSNFSVSVGGSATGVVGINASVALAMDTFPTNGKYGMAVTVNTGAQLAAGTADIFPGATIGFGLGWGPGSAADGEGMTMTAGGSLAAIDVAAQWSVPNDVVKALVTDALKTEFTLAGLTETLTSNLTASIQTMCQVPGVSAGVSIPVPANMGDVTFSTGYTYVAWRGSF